MFDNTKIDYRELGKKLLIVAGIIAAVIVAYKLLYYVIPFLIALILASLIEPLIKVFVKRLKMSRKVAAIICLLLVFLVLGTLFVFLIFTLVNQLVSLAKMLPHYYEQFEENLESLIATGNDFYNWLPVQITDNLGAVVSKISNSLVDLFNSILKGAVATAVSIPEAIVFTVVTILATFFIAGDRDKIMDFINRQLPGEWLEKADALRHDLFSALLGYLRAQLIIISITMTQLFLGFTIIGIRYSLLMAFLTGIIDALPILGTGTVLIPWGLYEMLIAGNLPLGISLLVIYVIVVIVRQLMEPKIVGGQIGIYPLFTLMGMYIGLKVFGFFGLLLGPVIVLILKNVMAGIMKNRTVKDMIHKGSTSLEKDGE